MTLDKQRRWLVLISVAISIFMATLDGSIVNIALPVITHSLNTNISSVQWIVTSYLLTISVLLLVWGKISDMYGRKIIFISGIAIFTIGSIMCGLSQNLPMLVVSRVFQAIGASSTMALSQGIIASIFPPSERGRALGITGTTVSIGSLVGPSLGGIILNITGWQTIFFINIPVGIIGIIFAIIVIPNLHEAAQNKKFDIKGSLLFIFSITMLFTGMLFFQDAIIELWVFISMFIVATLLLIFFVRYQLRIENPLIDLNLFKNRIFSFGLSSAFLNFIALNSTILFLPFYLLTARKFDPFTAGLILSAYPAVSAIVAPISGWLSDKITYRPLTIIGLSLGFISLMKIATFSTQTSVPELIIVMGLTGGSMSIFMSPNNSSVMGSVPKDRLGIAGGVSALFRNLGMVTGTTLSVIIFSFVSKINIDKLSGKFSLINIDMFMTGFRAVMILAALSCLFALIISIFRVSTTKKPKVKIIH